MKILIVTQYFYPENFRVNTFAEELVSRGHEVTVLTGYPQYPYGEIYPGYGFGVPYEKNWNGVQIERIKMRPRGKNIIGLLANCISFVSEGYKWVHRCQEKYDLVYVFEVSPVTVGLPAIRYKKKFGTPVFFNVQDLWPENVIEVLGINNKLVIGVINKIVDKIYGDSDIVLCSSKGFVENIANRGVPRDKLVFWPQFCKEPDMEVLKSPDIYDGNEFNVVFAGNLGYAQGLELLIETAEMVKDKPIHWYLVGDGRAKEKLMQLVAEKGLDEKVTFIGRVSEEEANSYVKYADCAYLSFNDCKLFDLTIPAKLQTYLACGVPILGAVGGESAEIIEKANCGCVVSKTAEAVSECLQKMMNMPDEMLCNMRGNAVNYFEENYQMEKLIDEFENLYVTSVEGSLSNASITD